MVEAKKIMQPFGDRSKVVIEPMLTDQWFVDTAKIVEPALEAVRTGRTKIIPQSGEKTYYHWLENIEPWCISRQLWWGHQIPVWYGPEPQTATTDGDVSLIRQLARCQRQRCCATYDKRSSFAAQAETTRLIKPLCRRLNFASRGRERLTTELRPRSEACDQSDRRS